MYWSGKIIRKIPPLLAQFHSRRHKVLADFFHQSFKAQSVAESLFGYPKLSTSIVWLRSKRSQTSTFPLLARLRVGVVLVLKSATSFVKPLDTRDAPWASTGTTW